MLDKVTRYLARQYLRRRPAEIVAPGYPILLDYPLKCSHRYGYVKPLISSSLRCWKLRGTSMRSASQPFAHRRLCCAKSPLNPAPEAIEPCWGPQRYFSSLDAVALYGMLFKFRPKRFA
jgi:hypothetical protein